MQLKIPQIILSHAKRYKEANMNPIQIVPATGIQNNIDRASKNTIKGIYL
jgi:hypothetical protein